MADTDSPNTSASPISADSLIRSPNLVERIDLTEDLILKCLTKRRSYPRVPLPLAGKATTPIPTLQPGVSRPASKMLSTRYQVMGRWVDAIHGHWLSTDDMESLWSSPIADLTLSEVWQQHLAAREDWPNIASSLFVPERLSLFAGSDIGNEKIYLLWLDFIDEPELWVYDSNGESRYKDLDDYLDAYLSDDVSASERPWRAGSGTTRP